MLTDDAIRAMAESIAKQINDGLPSCTCHERKPNEYFIRKITPALEAEIRRHLSQNEPNCNTSPQSVTGGDMARAVELLRGIADANAFRGPAEGCDCLECSTLRFLASIGGKP